MRDKTTFYEESGRPRPRPRFDSLFIYRTTARRGGHTTKRERMEGSVFTFLVYTVPFVNGRVYVCIRCVCHGAPRRLFVRIHGDALCECY